MTKPNTNPSNHLHISEQSAPASATGAVTANEPLATRVAARTTRVGGPVSQITPRVDNVPTGPHRHQ